MQRQLTPAFRFYPKDYLADEKVNAMSYEQRGVYMQALCLCWVEGSLPSNVVVLAAMFRIQLRRFRTIWPMVAACFTPVENSDRLTHKRLDLERALQKTFSDSRSQNAQKRWGKREDDDASALH